MHIAMEGLGTMISRTSLTIEQDIMLCSARHVRGTAGMYDSWTGSWKAAVKAAVKPRQTGPFNPDGREEHAVAWEG